MPEALHRSPSQSEGETAQLLLACEEVDDRRASAGQTEEFLADGCAALIMMCGPPT
jgi:hypothetical protein